MKSFWLPLMVKLVLYVMVIGLFIMIPTSFFESGPPVCLIKNIFHVNCPGCGMTRAISSIFHGRWNVALQYNQLVVIIFPLLLWIALKSVIKDFRNYRQVVRESMIQRCKKEND